MRRDQKAQGGLASVTCCEKTKDRCVKFAWPQTVWSWKEETSSSVSRRRCGICRMQKMVESRLKLGVMKQYEKHFFSRCWWAKELCVNVWSVNTHIRHTCLFVLTVAGARKHTFMGLLQWDHLCSKNNPSSQYSSHSKALLNCFFIIFFFWCGTFAVCGDDLAPGSHSGTRGEQEATHLYKREFKEPECHAGSCWYTIGKLVHYIYYIIFNVQISDLIL